VADNYIPEQRREEDKGGGFLGGGWGGGRWGLGGGGGGGGVFGWFVGLWLKGVQISYNVREEGQQHSNEDESRDSPKQGH